MASFCFAVPVRSDKFFLVSITLASSLWTASEWRETNLAEKLGAPLVSPDGCYRLETLNLSGYCQVLFTGNTTHMQKHHRSGFRCGDILAFIVYTISERER